MNRRAHLRASDADRDQIVERLRQAATEGRIAAEELEQRVSAALKARTYADLEATVADLPRDRDQERGRDRDHHGRRAPTRRSAGGWALTTVRSNPALLLFAIPVVAVTAAMLLAATIIWAVTMIVVMVLGGRPRPMRGPWIYTRARRACGPPRRGPRSYWA
ncbi:MAG: DUF1707 SHOCT-like domain-containing protein [Solirubrobacteraceae bacterium]